MAGPLYLLLGKAAEALTGLLNRWAVWVSAKPGAGLYFDTNYAALVCLAADGSVRAGHMSGRCVCGWLCRAFC